MPDAQTLPTGFSITPNVTGDEIINVASQTAGTNSFSVKLEHEAPFSESKTAKTASTGASGYGKTSSLKIPKVSIDKFGHVTELTEETVTINMPAAQTLPTSFNIAATGSGDAVISVTATGGANSVDYKIAHDEAGSIYTSGNTVTSIGAGESKTIKIPQISVDKYGHTNTAADENVTITIPAAPKIQTIAVNDDDVVNLTVSTSGTTTTITGTHIDDKTAYASNNTTVLVDVAEGEGKIKIPQLTTDKYGHVVVAADEEITFKAIQFKGDYNASTNKAATMADVTAAVADLNGAMHFKGVVTTEPNGTTPTGYKAGDIVIYQQKNNEGVVTVAIEYVFDGTTWYKLGDESLPQKIVDAAIEELKTGTITNNGDVDSATVDIITSLSQSSGVVGGTKETLNFNTAPTSSNKIATMTDVTNKINALDVTGVDLTQAETINVLKQTNGKISVSKQSILITADQVSDFDDRVGDSINELDWVGLDLTPGETIDTISQTDGKVTGTKQAIAITASQVTDFATEVGKLFPKISVTTDDDGMAKVSAEATGHSLTINTSHAEVGSATTSTANSGSVSGYGASKTISIPRVSTDKWGHVTSITNDSVSITMPSVSDTKMTQTVKADNVNYPLLAAASASPTSGAASTGVYDTGMTMNPSTNTIKATVFQGNLDGTADYATLAEALNSSAGSLINPIYFKDGKPAACTYSLNKTVPSDAVFTDTKVNTTLGTTTKAYLLGTTTTPTSTAQGVTAIADTGVYLDTTAGTLTATTFKGNLDGNASSADLADAVQGTLKIQANGTDKISYSGSTSPTLNITTGSGNGTISIGGTDVSVKGLGSNAYTSTAHLPLTGGTITGNITFNANNSSQKNEPKLIWKTIGQNTPYVGFAEDQTDGTFVICSMERDAEVGTNGSRNYKNGLAIGGGTGNLFWKGNKVATVEDINELDYADTAVTKQYVSEVDQTNGLISVKRTALPVAAGNSTGIVKGFHHTTGAATGTQVTNAANAPAIAARTTTSGRYYGVETDKNGTLFVNVPWTDTNSDTKVKQSPSTTDGEFPILLRSTSAGTTETTTTTSFNTTTTINPSSGRISIKTSEPTIYGSYGAVDVNLIEGNSSALYASNGISYSNSNSGADIYYNSTEKCITFEFY